MMEACPRNCEPITPSFDNCDNGQQGQENGTFVKIAKNKYRIYQYNIKS